MRRQAPWRKSKKNPQEYFYFYDWTNQSFNRLGGAEVTTSNRYELLSEEDHWNDLDPSTSQIEPTEEVVLPDCFSFNKFMLNDNLIYDCNYYMYERKKKNCSGYFPSFITLDDDKYNLISQNTNLDNIKNNYYLKIKGNMYLKQIVNKNSRYNFEYFNNLKDAYQVRGAAISQSGVAPKLQQVNNSQTGVTAHNSQTGVIAHREASGKTQQPQPQPEDNSQTGVNLQSRFDTFTYTGAETPCIKNTDKPRKKLFDNIEIDKIEIDIVPEEVNLEVLLINSLVINVIKVQAVVEKFVRDKEYNSIFCMTETKVDSHDFEPRGIKIFSKHRFKKDKKGGGLTIGFKKDHRIKLEEIKVKNQDILALEGTIMNTKIIIVLSYFDSTKLKNGKDFNRNRKIQKDIEKLIEVDPGTTLICLGDFNGRLTKLEPNIVTDANGKMLEDWVNNFDLHHLNTTDKCTGKYTFHSLNGRSAIDHVLINDTLFENFVGMHIDEDRTMLSISDHSLVRVWFRLGNDKEKTDWKKKKSKIITWISREEDRLKIFESVLLPKIGKKISFRKCMDKLKSTLNSTMRRRKKIKLGNKNNMKLLAAEWVDDELIGNIKLRSQYSREWRYARKNKCPPNIIEQCKNRYLKQQRLTSIMSGDKKSQWEKEKITETWKDGKKFWKMIKELLGKNKELVEEAYVFTEDGIKEEILDCEDNFENKWKDSVYQKMEKNKLLLLVW